MDRNAEFTLLVLRQYGPAAADAIDSSTPRLLFIAGDITRYDDQAVQQIPRNTELIRYRRYGEDLLLAVVTAAMVDATSTAKADTAKATATIGSDKPSEGKPHVLQLFDKCSPDRDRFEALRAYALGDAQEYISLGRRPSASWSTVTHRWCWEVGRRLTLAEVVTLTVGNQTLPS